MSAQHKLFFLLLLGLAVIIAYFSSLDHSFTYLDDQVQVVNNPSIKDLNAQNIQEIFSSTSVGMYQPITSLIYAAVYQIGQLNPMAFHLASLIFHLLNCLLVFLLLQKLNIKDWTLILLCVIFALHPMQVESISWISAFSNLVFTTFYLLALINYLKYLEKSALKYYWFSLLFFLISCFSKATAVSLPLVLIAFDYFKTQKFEYKLIVQKIPFILLSLVFGIITLMSREAAGHLSDLSVNFGVIDRLFLISYSILFYPIKFLWGFGLSAFYPYPEYTNGWLPWEYYAAFAVLLIVIGLIYKHRDKKGILIGTLIYLLIIAPTLHFVPVGNQLTADRYIYLPMIGLLLILSYFLKNINSKSLKIFSVIMLIGLGLMSFKRSKVWENDKAIWTDVIQKHPNVAQAHNNLGSYLLLEGKKQEAFRLFDKAVKLKPYYADAYNNRGNLYSQAGESEKALADFNKAIELRPHADAYFNRANELSKKGNFQLALEDYSKSIDLMPSPDTYTNRAYVKLNLDRNQEAVKDLKQAIKLDPTYHQAYFLLAMEARKRVDFQDACNYLKKAAQYGNAKAAAGYQELCKDF